MSKQTDVLFRPSSIAIVGASRQEEGIGRVIMQNLLSNNYQGLLFPVNPKAHSILSFKAFDKVTEIPDPVDLAIIAVPKKIVISVLEDCGEKGIPTAIIITAGFGETGEKGEELEMKIVKVAEENDIMIVGPNCLGIINSEEEVSMNATFADYVPKQGNISFISQSGAVGIYALEYAKYHNIKFSKFVSLGNKASSDENDMLEFLIDDEKSEVILSYLEELDEPARFFKLSAKNMKEKQKPHLIIKSGQSSSGQRAAASHTGALTENEAFLNDLFEQYGILRFDNLEAMFQSAQAIANQPLPDGNKICILTNAGGPGIITADAAEKAGLDVPELSKQLQKELKEALPSTASFNNPVDIIGDADADRYRSALKVLTASDEVNIILIICAPPRHANLLEIAEAIGDFVPQAKERNTLLVTAIADFSPDSKAFNILSQNHIPTYRFGVNAITACQAASKLFAIRSRPNESKVHFDVDKNKAADVLQKAKERSNNFLMEFEAYELFKIYGFRVAPYVFIKGKEDMDEGSLEISFPVVLKAMSPQIIHKSDKGAVKTNIKNPEELKQLINQMSKRLEEDEDVEELTGFLVQEMVEDGTELILGAKHEKGYGHLLLFGLGGIFVEILKDVSYRRAPILPFDARSMIEQIQHPEMLQGVRGKPAVNKKVIQEYLLRLSQLTEDFPEIKEIDLNPVFGLEDKAVLADARVFVHAKEK